MISTGVPENDGAHQLLLCGKIDEGGDGFCTVDRIHEDTFGCGEKIDRLHYPGAQLSVASQAIPDPWPFANQY
jgi:hypothetical protein